MRIEGRATAPPSRRPFPSPFAPRPAFSLPLILALFPYLGVHLVPAPDGGVVVRGEQPFVRPGEVRGVEAVVGFFLRQGDAHAHARDGQASGRPGPPAPGGGVGGATGTGGSRDGGGGGELLEEGRTVRAFFLLFFSRRLRRPRQPRTERVGPQTMRECSQSNGAPAPCPLSFSPAMKKPRRRRLHGRRRSSALPKRRAARPWCGAW